MSSNDNFIGRDIKKKIDNKLKSKQDDVLKILNKNKENRKYSKAEGKLIYEFINSIAQQHVFNRLKKYDNGKK